MKKALFIFFIFIGSINVCTAQNLEEVVYLKNGSIIRGVIMEQVPGETLKIETKDGNVFVCQMNEVEKITKETPLKKDDDFSLGAGNKRGYKAFIDAGYTFGIGDFKEDRLEITTSHGVQINPYVYIGGGVGANYWIDSELFSVPVFFNSRINFINKQISPYLDIKAGYSFFDVEGLYIAPSFGCKIWHFNVSIGYTIQRTKVEWYYFTLYDSGYYTTTNENLNGINFKLGFEF